MLELTGDQGARPLLDAHPDAIAEVPVPSPAIHADFDTPEAMAGLKSS
jgi:CTP:molybdopterin cytidylyltransferase MocA